MEFRNERDHRRSRLQCGTSSGDVHVVGSDMVLVKRSRLSVQPVTPEQFAIVERLGKA